MLTLLLVTSLIAAPSPNERFAAGDDAAKPAEAKAVDLRDADGKVLVAADEISAYDWATHTLTATPEAVARLKKHLRDAKKLDLPFAVAVGGKTAYEGRLTTVLSSQSLGGVVIVVDDPRAGKEGSVRLQLGYPGANFYKGKDDPRGDAGVKAALEAAGKLK